MLDLVTPAVVEQSVNSPKAIDIVTPKAEVVLVQEAPPPAPLPAIVPPPVPEASPAIPSAESPAEPVATPVEASSPAELSVSETATLSPVAPSPEPVAASTPSSPEPTGVKPTQSVVFTAPTVSKPFNTYTIAKQERIKVIEEKLATLVEQEKPTKALQLEQNLTASALNYAKQGQFQQARQTVQNPGLSINIQATTQVQIDQLETHQNQVTQKHQNQVAQKGQNQVAQKYRNQVAQKYQEQEVAQQFMNVTRPSEIARPRIAAISWVGLNSQTRNGSGSDALTVVEFVGPSVGNTTASGTSYYQQNVPPTMLGNGNISLIFPLITPAPLTSPFGWRVHPITGDSRFHYGTDLGAPYGTPIVAAYSGRVEVADYQGGYGLAVTMLHNDNTQQTLYAHMSEVYVKAGDWVEQGTVIGRVGSTGNSTGPHLHFEFWQLTTEGWVAMDPGTQLEYAMAQLAKALQAAQAVGQPAQVAGQPRL